MLDSSIEKPDFFTASLGPLAFFMAYVMPLVVYAQSLYGGWVYYLLPLYMFLIFPVLDFFLASKGYILSYDYNPGPEEEVKLRLSKSYQWAVWLCVPLQTILVFWALALAASGLLNGFEFLGLALSVGIVTGTSGITVAHELIHKTQNFQRWMGLGLLLQVCYMHFYISHLRGHHQWAATAKDPSSARLGESFYHFYGRSLGGAWLSAWGFENQRLQKKHLPFWRHQMFWFTLLPALLGVCLIFSWGWMVLLFWVLQSWVAFSLLELINYIQHYGLERRELTPGVYEPFQIHHAWNSRHLMSNCNLFLLQRHSDHHLHQSKPFQVVHQYPTAPQLPMSYGGMVMLALLPILWRRIMDPRAQAYCLDPKTKTQLGQYSRFVGQEEKASV